MKKNILVKQFLGTASVRHDSATGVMVYNRKDTMLNPIGENSLTIARAETKNKMQPLDEFRYSGRCYCGTY